MRMQRILYKDNVRRKTLAFKMIDVGVSSDNVSAEI